MTCYYSINPTPFHQSYELDNEILGKGNFSVVHNGLSRFRKNNLDTNSHVAVKCVSKENMNQDEILALFDEVSILQQLHHPHIIRLHDFFEEPNFFYLVLERIDGGELFDRIVAKEFYNENEARNVCRIMLSALEYMHSVSIVHRDLKPENILVQKSNDSLIKIADFGFAKRCDDSCNDGTGNLLTQCGTPTYVSPEIIQRKSYGSKSDLWSVGVIAFVLLGGYPPFMENDQRELFRKICCGDFIFHDEYFQNVSDSAKNFISSLIEIEPKKRLSAKDALKDPWICSGDDMLVKQDLSGVNLTNLKRFNAKRKVKAAVHSLIAVNKLTSLLCGDLRIRLD